MGDKRSAGGSYGWGMEIAYQSSSIPICNLQFAIYNGRAHILLRFARMRLEI
jgi:hypothetical protein